MTTNKKTKKQDDDRFRRLTVFMLRMLPGCQWKLPLTFLLGLAQVAVMVLMPLIAARIINTLVVGDWIAFRRNLLMQALLIFGQCVIGFSHSYAFIRIDERVGNNLRRTLVETVLGKRLPFFDSYSVGDIVSRTVNDSMMVKGFLTGTFLQLIYDGITIAVIVGVLILMNPTLALLTIATAPITILSGQMSQRRLEAATMGVRMSMASYMESLQSWMSHPFALKIHSLEKASAQRLAGKNDALTVNSVRAGLLGTIIGIINTTLLSVPSLVIFGYGGYITLKGRLSIGELFAFMTYAAFFYAPIQRLVNIMVVSLPTLYPVHQRLDELLTASEADASAEAETPAPVERLHARELTFSFAGQEAYSLEVPSFVAHKGEIVGLAGENGSGKSTLARLLAGVYQPHTGEVAFDGAEHEGDSPVASRHLFSFLPQEAVIFDGTLLENVTLFEEQPDRARLSRIEEELNMKDWLASMPDGWATEINAGVMAKFSGGQMQKIGLARLLYRQRPIIFLDEPTNGLDDSTRLILERVLSKARSHSIIIIITHSNEALSLCDRIYHLRPVAEGRRDYECVEKGIPEELLLAAEEACLVEQ